MASCPNICASNMPNPRRLVKHIKVTQRKKRHFYKWVTTNSFFHQPIPLKQSSVMLCERFLTPLFKFCKDVKLRVAETPFLLGISLRCGIYFFNYFQESISFIKISSF